MLRDFAPVPRRPKGSYGEFRTSGEIGHGYISGATFAEKLISYAVIDGEAIFEGDIVLDGRLTAIEEGHAVASEASAEITQAEGVVERAIVITGAQFRWPNGMLPFEIDANLPAAQQTAITDAINHWRSHTRIGFVQRNAQNQAQFPNFVRFLAGNGCSSSVGKVGGQQNITLGAGCGTGQAIHEIGHAVGLWHEQSRKDRDTFVTINWANIDPAERFNFDQHVTDGEDVGKYDYDSIMHYPADAFSINGQSTIVPKQAGVTIGNRNALSLSDTAGVRSMYGSLQPPQDRTWLGDFRGDGRTDLISYVPSRFNWWLGSWTTGQLGLLDVGNTAGFGQVGDGRPFWIGDFNGDGRDEVLFYYPGDDNWWLGTFNGTSLVWALAGNTRGFGHAINDGRPFWTGRFSRTDRVEILFYHPADDNWWLGTMTGNNLTWAFAGNTRGFGHAINDGRPFWIGDFTGDGRSDILFYYPGDDNWWLGTFRGTSLSWALAGNTRGFGHKINDGRPFWIADFNGDGKAEVLFYYPGDDNWWLGTFSGGALSWTLAGNTIGFGHRINDGRPFWVGRFVDNTRASMLFYYPSDGEWWIGRLTGGSLVWSVAGDF